MLACADAAVSLSWYDAAWKLEVLPISSLSRHSKSSMLQHDVCGGVIIRPCMQSEVTDNRRMPLGAVGFPELHIMRP